MASKKSKSNQKRVAFRKNRHKRRRQTDLTRQAAEDMDAVADLESTERLSGKGDLSRHRTIIVDDDDEPESGDLSECSTGRVLSAIGSNNCSVQESGSGQVWHCSVRRLVRTMFTENRSAVVTGDEVLFRPVDREKREGVIEKVEPRTSALTRDYRHSAHVIVANVDQAVIVVSVDEPALKPGLIDRFLCSTEKGGIDAIICINKTDLGSPADLQPLVGQYSRLGYAVVLTNALTGEGISHLRNLLTDRETVFTGQSGVGKSSLLNAVQPNLSRPTSTISQDTNKGRHTTRVTELLQLDGGGWVVDTPGIRQLQLWDVAQEEIEHLMIEFRPFVQFCKFPNCSHLHETGCGIRAAVDDGLISPLRYISYCRMLRDEEA